MRGKDLHMRGESFNNSEANNQSETNPWSQMTEEVAVFDPDQAQQNIAEAQAANASEAVADQKESQPFTQKYSKIWPILSFIATMIPIILFSYCFIISGGSTNESGSGAIWWVIIIYYWTAGIPLAIISIAFGIIGLKTNLSRLATVSLFLKSTMIIIIVFRLFIH